MSLFTKRNNQLIPTIPCAMFQVCCGTLVIFKNVVVNIIFTTVLLQYRKYGSNRQAVFNVSFPEGIFTTLNRGL